MRIKVPPRNTRCWPTVNGSRSSTVFGRGRYAPPEHEPTDASTLPPTIDQEFVTDGDESRHHRRWVSNRAGARCGRYGHGISGQTSEPAADGRDQGARHRTVG